MVVAHFRFYEELNDFLPPGRRKRTFAHDCGRGATVKHAVEALGVPHTEVEVILVNGESVDFSHWIRPAFTSYAVRSPCHRGPLR